MGNIDAWEAKLLEDVVAVHGSVVFITLWIIASCFRFVMFSTVESVV
jgi:hypothetical protein